MTTRVFALRAIGAMALLVAALAFAACGGDDDGGALSKEDYRKQAQQINDEFDKQAEPAFEAAQSKDPEKSLTGVVQMADSSTSAANKLDALEPPEEFKDVHGKLVGSLRTLGDRGNKVEQAAEAQDESAIEPAVESFQQSIVELERVGDEYEKTTGVS